MGSTSYVALNLNVPQRLMIHHKLCALVAIPVALDVDEDEGKTCRLESERVSRSRAEQPRDAIRRFAEAITARDITGVLTC